MIGLDGETYWLLAKAGKCACCMRRGEQTSRLIVVHQDLNSTYDLETHALCFLALHSMHYTMT